MKRAKSVELFRAGRFVFIHSAFARLINVLMHVVLARGLGPSTYGVFSVGISLTDLSSRISLLGIQEGLIRFIPLTKVEDRTKPSAYKPALLFFNSLSVVFISLGLVGVAFLVFSGPIAEGIFGNPALRVAIFWSGVLIPLYGLMRFFNGYIQAQEQFDIYAFLNFSGRAVLTFLLVSVVVALFHSVVLAFAALGVSVSSVIIASLFWMKRRELPLSFYGPLLKKYIFQVLRFSLPILFVSFSFNLLSNIDKLMLAKFVSTHDVGIYSAASRITMQTGVIMLSFNAAFMPRISRLFASGELQNLNAEYKDITRWSLTLVLPILSLFFFFPKVIMAIFGTAYYPSAPVIQVLVLGVLVKALVGPTSRLLQMTGKQDYTLLNSILLILLNVSLNYILIRKFGVVGAAIATSLSLLAINLFELVEVRLILGLWPFDRKFLRLLASSLAALLLFSVVSITLGGFFLFLATAFLWFSIFLGFALTGAERRVIFSSIVRLNRQGD